MKTRKLSEILKESIKIDSLNKHKKHPVIGPIINDFSKELKNLKFEDIDKTNLDINKLWAKNEKKYSKIIIDIVQKEAKKIYKDKYDKNTTIMGIMGSILTNHTTAKDYKKMTKSTIFERNKPIMKSGEIVGYSYYLEFAIQIVVGNYLDFSAENEDFGKALELKKQPYGGYILREWIYLAPNEKWPINYNTWSFKKKIIFKIMKD